MSQIMAKEICMIKIMRVSGMLLGLIGTSLMARNTFFEFKSAAFLPTDSCMKNIYGRAAGMYGPEVTIQLSNDHEHWYAFAGADFLTKKGHSIGLCQPTKMYMIPLSVGVKYLMSWCHADWYIGLGFQAVYLKTVNCLLNGLQTTSNWGFGGIAQTGAFIHLPRHFFIDPFVSYNFAKVSSPVCTGSCIKGSSAKLNGVALGLGIGYQFD
jgi:hypothetical protein